MTRFVVLSASAPRMNDVVAGRWLRMSSRSWSDTEMCSVRSGYVDGNFGASSMADTTCVIPSCFSSFTSSAVARQVR
jgi:hypothetical protein